MEVGYTSLGKEDMYVEEVICHHCAQRVALDVYCSHCGNKLVTGKELPILDGYRDNTTFVVRDHLTNKFVGCISDACRHTLFQSISNDIVQCVMCGKVQRLTSPMHINNTKTEKEEAKHE